MVSFGLLVAGAVSATSDMDKKNVTDLNVTVLDENSQPVVEATVGDNVTAEIKASSTKLIKDPVTTIEIDPKDGIEFLPDEAQMWNGSSWIQNDENPFLYKLGDAWIWEMGKFLYPGTELILQLPGQVSNTGEINVTADLYGAIVKHKDRHDGNCNDNNWYQHDGNCNDNNWYKHDGKYNDNRKCNHNDPQIRLLDTANYLFNAVEPQAAGGGDNGNGSAAGGDNGNIATAATTNNTVPMQTTGAPLALAILALFAILGGSIYGRLK